MFSYIIVWNWCHSRALADQLEVVQDFIMYEATAAKAETDNFSLC